MERNGINMVNKQSFKLSKKQQEYCKDILFKIQSLARFLSFLIEQFNFVDEDKRQGLIESFNYFSKEMVSYYELQEKEYFQIDQQYRINILDIPRVQNIQYEIYPEEGVIIYTYEIG